MIHINLENMLRQTKKKVIQLYQKCCKSYHINITVTFTRRHKYVFLALAIFLGTSIFYYSLPANQNPEQNKSTTLETTTTTTTEIPPTENFRIKETEDFLINTPGCYIPNYAKTFMFNRPVISSAKSSCGDRAVFIDTLDNNTVKFRIDKKTMEKYYTTHRFQCCYKYVSESTIHGHESDQLSYTRCKFFRNGEKIMLKHETITVSCYSFELKSRTKDRVQIIVPVYKDAYIILKQIEKDIPIKTNNSNIRWNILMIGVDAMSRTRVFDTMPRTTNYLKKYKWADYKGYQKVDHEAFSYLLTVLTGKKMSTIISNCTSGLINCTEFFPWEQYKDAGYITAYGEDYLQYPDAFAKFKGFKTKPTDHYMRPLFMTRESRLGKIVCTHKKPSATHLLEYAHDFVDSYKTNPFFGIFFIKSYTHNILNDPSLIDIEIADFFENLNNSGVYKNTFVIFYSDHGIRFGENRLRIESYYDERLPMLFLWTPIEFRRLFTDEFHNLQLNQGRLITPYDLYLTLADILKLSIKSSDHTQSEACPQCSSLFEEILPNRTCAAAGISTELCSCHNISKTESQQESDVVISLDLAISHIHKIWMSIKTLPYMMCKPLKFPSIMRSHVYQDGNKTYHVIAFKMSPNSILFETLVVRVGENFKLLSLRSISPYNVKGNCVLDNVHRPYCVCFIDWGCNNCTETKKLIKQ